MSKSYLQEAEEARIRAEEEKQRAEAEICRLLDELKQGRLNRNELEIGLKEVSETVGRIPTHLPHSPDPLT
jgi:hypothetical protein